MFEQILLFINFFIFSDPPDSPIIRFLLNNATEVRVQDIANIQSQNNSLKCENDGNPALTYYWSPGQTRDETVVTMDVKTDLTTLNCTATNEMKPSYGRRCAISNLF